MDTLEIFCLVVFGINVVVNLIFVFIKEDTTQAFNAFLGWSLAFLYAFAFFGVQ